MNKVDPSNEFLIPTAERINFYLNNQERFEISVNEFERVKKQTAWNKLEMHMASYADFQKSFIHWYCKHIVHLPILRNIRVVPIYKSYKNLHSLMNFFLPIDRLDFQFKEVKFPFFFGETGSTENIPCIRKSRRSEDHTSVLFNFRTLRLTAPCAIAKKKDRPWDQKMDNVIWRGATTGETQRINFVEKHINKYDVAFASVKQKPHLKHLQNYKVTISDQLKYKFIISLEGNDVASNLRWILSSNSVPIMTKPYWQSWIIEQKLEPFVHYLELNEDLSNLDELLNWAAQNDEKCNQIAQNGKKYMSQFLDFDKDLLVQKALLEEYAKRVAYIN